MSEESSIDLSHEGEGFVFPGGKFISYGFLFAVLLVGVTIFRFWLLSEVPLSSDEAYHWEWSRHLDFAYYDHPGLVAWVIWIFTKVFGHTLTGIRMGALASSTLILVVIYLLAKDIYESRRTGFYSFALAAFTGIFAASSLMMTTDPPYAAFWALAVLFIYKAVFKEKPGYFYLAGIAFGFSMLGKFLGLLLVPCVLFFFIFSPANRHWLRRKEPYLGFLLGLLMLAPVVYWNSMHDWSTFAFNLSIRHEGLEPHALYLLEYLAGQLLLVWPYIFLPLLYILWKAWGLRGNEEESRAFFLASFTAVPLIAFGFVSIFERAGAHWPAAAYITGIPLFTGWYLKRNTGMARRHIKNCLVISVLLLSAGHVFIFRPDFIPEFRYEAWPEKINTKYLREYYGWHELGEVLAGELEKRGHENIFLATPYYSMSAVVSFYTPGRPFCHHLGPESIHGNNYRYWTDWEGLSGRDAIIIDVKRPRGSKRRRLKRAFTGIVALDPLPVYSRGKLVRTFYLTFGYNFKGRAPR